MISAVAIRTQWQLNRERRSAHAGTNGTLECTVVDRGLKQLTNCCSWIIQSLADQITQKTLYLIRIDIGWIERRAQCVQAQFVKPQRKSGIAQICPLF